MDVDCKLVRAKAKREAAKAKRETAQAAPAKRQAQAKLATQTPGATMPLGVSSTGPPRQPSSTVILGVSDTESDGESIPDPGDKERALAAAPGPSTSASDDDSHRSDYGSRDSEYEDTDREPEERGATAAGDHGAHALAAASPEDEDGPVGEEVTDASLGIRVPVAPDDDVVAAYPAPVAGVQGPLRPPGAPPAMPVCRSLEEAFDLDYFRQLLRTPPVLRDVVVTAKPVAAPSAEDVHAVTQQDWNDMD